MRASMGIELHLLFLCCGKDLAIGAILIRRMEVRPFTDKQIDAVAVILPHRP